MSRNEAFAPWQCPLCGGTLHGENDLKCEKGHCFDRAREGYWHLLPVQSMRTKAPGDSKEMVAARRAFLNAGYYGIFGQALGELCLAHRTSICPYTEPCQHNSGQSSKDNLRRQAHSDIAP